MLRFKVKERIADLEFRERRRVQLQEIAAATGLNRMTLSKLINHHGVNVQTDVIDKLCTFFGCRIEELVEHLADDNPSGDMLTAQDDARSPRGPPRSQGTNKTKTAPPTFAYHIAGERGTGL